MHVCYSTASISSYGVAATRIIICIIPTSNYLSLSLSLSLHFTYYATLGVEDRIASSGVGVGQASKYSLLAPAVVPSFPFSPDETAVEDASVPGAMEGLSPKCRSRVPSSSP